MVIEKIHVKDFKGIHEVCFENLGRINYIVGPNGCGKSSFFELMALTSKHILEGQRGDIQFSIYGDLHQIFRKDFSLDVDAKISEKNFNSRIKINVGTATMFRYTPSSFPVHTETPDNLSAHKWNALLLDMHTSQDEGNFLNKRHYEFEIDRLDSEEEGEKITEFLNSNKYTQENELIRQMRRSLTETQSVQFEIVPKSAPGSRGRLEQIRALSTGYKQLIALYSSLRKSMLNHINNIGGRIPIVCIEEPERSLHPEFQKQVPVILDAILSEDAFKNTTVFITTHSPFVISASSNFPEQRTYLMKNGYTIDKAGNIKVPSRGYLAEHCLDVAASLLGAGLEDVAVKPETKEKVTVVYCEGAGKGVKDSDVYREIFLQDENAVFVSCGSFEDVHRAYLASRVGVGFVFGEQAESLALFDCSNSFHDIPLNDERVIQKTGVEKIKFSEEERELIVNSDPHKGYRMLKRKEIENYLFDPIVLSFLENSATVWAIDKFDAEEMQISDVDCIEGEVKDYLVNSGNAFKMQLAKIIRGHKDSETKFIYDELRETIFGDT